MLPFQMFIDNFEVEYILVANDDTEFTFQTNKNAPRYKLVKVDLRYPESWSDLVQESEKDVLKLAVYVNGNQILVSYLSDVTYVLQVRDLQSGKFLHNLPIDIGPGPTIGKAPTSSRCILTVSLPPLHGIST